MRDALKDFAKGLAPNGHLDGDAVWYLYGAAFLMIFFLFARSRSKP